DKADEKAIHVLLKREDKLVAYTRIVPHTDQVHISFGRVLVVKEYRKHELGRKVVQATLNQIQKQFPAKEIKIQAQSYLQNFYSSFGFSPVSDVYLEDNIPHLDMILKK
ncbi:GNAT family N-acetyltransferase, partial [Ligilactobacillus acidipiscis]